MNFYLGLETFDMLNVFRMDALPDDVSISCIGSFDDRINIRPLYEFVKIQAKSIAEEYPRALVEMGEQYDFPHASVYVNDKIIHQIVCEFGE
jgi:hypothetical protein